MKALNLCQFIGNIGRDLEIKTLASGMNVLNFAIACAESWKDKNSGEFKERTEWVNVTVYGRSAEVIQQYARKGDRIYVSGRMSTRKWQDKSGNDRYTTEIIVNDFLLLGKRDKGDDNSQPQQPHAPAPAAAPEDFDDDIPF